MTLRDNLRTPSSPASIVPSSSRRRQPVSDHPTLFGFTQFCGAQPANRQYTFLDKKSCAFGQYLQSLGYTDFLVGGFSWDDLSGSTYINHEIPHSQAIAVRPHTFGALYTRLKSGEYRNG